MTGVFSTGLCVLWLAGLHAAAVAPRTTLVMPLAAQNGVTPDLAALATTLLVGDLRKALGGPVMAYSEVESAMSEEQRRMLSGCDAASCMAEIAGSLNADQVVLGSIGKLGQNYLLHLTLMDRTTRTLGSVTRQFPQDEAVLGRQVPSAVAELLVQPGAPLPVNPASPAPAAAADPVAPPSPSAMHTTQAPVPGFSARVLAPLFRISGGIGLTLSLVGLLASVMGGAASAMALVLYLYSINTPGAAARPDFNYRVGAFGTAGLAISLGAALVSLLGALSMACLFVVAATLD